MNKTKYLLGAVLLLAAPTAEAASPLATAYRAARAAVADGGPRFRLTVVQTAEGGKYVCADDAGERGYNKIDLRTLVLLRKGECADLAGADLREIGSKGAGLIGMDLGGANLAGADLGGARMQEVRLTGAVLTGAELKGADLSRARLAGADLRGALLQGADLTSAVFVNADLRGANLAGAMLRRTNFRMAKTEGAVWE